MVHSTKTDIFIKIETPDADLVKLDRLSHNLQAEISHLQVTSIKQAITGTSSTGTKAAAEIAAGALIVQLAPFVIPPLFELIKEWIRRPNQPPMTVIITEGKFNAKIEYDPTKTSPQELQKLINKLKRKSSKRN